MWGLIWLLLIIFCAMPPIAAEVITRKHTDKELSISLADEGGDEK